MNNMLEAVASGSGQPEVTFKALEKQVRETIGVKLFTLMEIDYERQVAWRNYSNMPGAYPVSGEKPLQQNAWSDTVEKRQQIFVANSIDEIAAVFSDYELIQSLGCESCLNLPVAGHYTPERIAAAERLKLPGALAFLMSASSRD